MNKSTQKRLRGIYPTDSGMHCIWDSTAFLHIQGYDSWEAELCEDADIRRHIQAGHFVPINIRSDGIFDIEVRVGSLGMPAALSDREHKYLLVASEPYRFISNGTLCVSGIEYVEGQPSDSVGKLDVTDGEYAVTVNLISWDDEPGMRATDGSPLAEALPDFVVLVNPSSSRTQEFRMEMITFSP